MQKQRTILLFSKTVSLFELSDEIKNLKNIFSDRETQIEVRESIKRDDTYYIHIWEIK